MSETRKYCCCGLFSLEKGSEIISIFNLLIAITAYIGMIHIPFEKGGTRFKIGFGFVDYYYIEIASIIVLIDIGLSVLVTPILIYGISKERSAYFPPWFIFYVLNLAVVSELSFKMTHLTTS